MMRGTDLTHLLGENDVFVVDLLFRRREARDRDMIVRLPTSPTSQDLSSWDAASCPLSYNDSLSTAVAGELGDMQTQFRDVVAALAQCPRKLDVPEISASNQAHWQQPMTSGVMFFGANMLNESTSMQVPTFDYGSAREFLGGDTSMLNCQPQRTQRGMAPPIPPWPHYSYFYEGQWDAVSLPRF